MYAKRFRVTQPIPYDINPPAIATLFSFVVLRHVSWKSIPYRFEDDARNPKEKERKIIFAIKLGTTKAIVGDRMIRIPANQIVSFLPITSERKSIEIHATRSPIMMSDLPRVLRLALSQ